MQIVKKLMMLSVAVDDMPKAKAFYEETLGLEKKMEYRQDDKNWWVELMLPDDGAHLTLSTYLGNMKPGTLVLYFSTDDLEASHKELSDKGLKLTEIADDLHGPGSGTKWFSLEDPEGNKIHMEQA